MFRLLNRIAIAVSIVLWFCITLLFLLIDWWIRYFNIDDLIVFLIINLVIAFIIKSLFLSQWYIKSRLEFFFEAVIQRQEKTSLVKELTKSKELKNKEETKIVNIKHSDDKLKKSRKKVEKKEENIVFTMLKNFFSKNLLAKLWAILVFLWVLFLIWLVWNQVPNLLKLIIGFAIGFAIYFSWVYLDKKWVKQESKILIWTWILINFLVILWWKFVLEWTSFNEYYLSTWASFILLILNTIFAVITWLLYRSKAIIYLSFLFAYINPFLTGWSSDNPYTLLIYSSIVSIWAIFLWTKLKDNIILIWSLILSWLVILVAPFSTEIWAITKIIFSIIIWTSFWIALFKNKFKLINLIFSIIWIFVLLNTSYFIWELWELNNKYLIISSIVSLSYLAINYILTRKEELKFLYSISSVITALWLSTILYWFDELNYINISIVLITWIIITLYPFFNKNILGENSSIYNLSLGNIAWIIFIWAQLFIYWNEYFPWLILGFAFIWLAIYYFLLGIIITYKFPIEKTINIENIKNNIYNYLAFSVALFTISVAIIFENSNIIISIIWLIEASILYYFYNKTNKNKIFYAATTLFFIWIIKLIEYSDNIIRWEHLSLISVAIILAILLFNVKKLKNSNSVNHKILSHDIIHIIWIISVINIWYEIIDNNLYGLNIFVSSIIITVIWAFYAYYASNILKVFYIVLFIIFWLNHIWSFDLIAYKIEKYDLNYLIIFQYISTIILSIWVYLFNRLNIVRLQKIYLNVSLIIYLLIIVSLFIYNYFENTFAITIFWWIVSIYLLIRWISLNKIKYRTLWLYLLTLVSLKIFLFDIWYSIEDAISRVIVFIVLWILLIIVSVKYSKKYWDNLAWEFNIKNFKKIDIIHEVKDDENDEIIIDKLKITRQIQKIDVSGINIASFKIDWKIAFSTKSKNLLQIITYVINKTWTESFNPWELNDFYEFITTNYISELNKRDLNTVKNTFKEFIDKWWEVIIK